MNYEKELRELDLMQQIYASIFTLTNKIQVQGDKRLDPLTVRQFMTMAAIVHLPEEEATLSRIAAKTGTTKQNIRGIISGLEKKKAVKTTPSSIDKRAVNIKLTRLGMQALSLAGEKSIPLLADLFSEFTSGELKLLRELLKKMYRFDGQAQDGFEEDASKRVGAADKEKENRLLNEFRKRRAGKEQPL